MRFAIVASALLATLAYAAPPDAVQKDLDAGMKRLTAMKYADAAKLLEKVVKTSAASKAQKARANEALGNCYVALRRESDAEAAYLRLLNDNPRANLPPNASPKLRDFFTAVKSKKFPQGMVDLRRESDAPDGSVTVRLVDPWRRAAKVVRISRVGESKWTRQVVSSPDGQVYKVAPPVQDKKADVEWYVEAHGPDGIAVASVGTSSTPFVVKRPGGAVAGDESKADADAPWKPKRAGEGRDKLSDLSSGIVPGGEAGRVTSVQAEQALAGDAKYEASGRKEGGFPWWLLGIAVLAVGAAGGGAYYLSQQPTGQTQFTLGQKQ